jgi:hypothetical protein
MKFAFAGMALLALGCAGTQRTTNAQSTSSTAGTLHQRSAACVSQDHEPVEIAYRDAPGGGSVLFATDGSPDALRARVEQLAEFHNSNDTQLAMHDLYSIPHRAKVEPLERGAKLILTASANNDEDALRKSVQQDVEQLKAHGCIASEEAL